MSLSKLLGEKRGGEGEAIIKATYSDRLDFIAGCMRGGIRGTGLEWGRLELV